MGAGARLLFPAWSISLIATNLQKAVPIGPKEG
jgi:hypothetical protein